jgi:hypothetical protein
MKNLLVIAVLLIIIWEILVISFDKSASVHFILLLAAIIIFIKFLLNKKQLRI